jgi:hypothetical protein
MIMTSLIIIVAVAGFGFYKLIQKMAQGLNTFQKVLLAR